MGATENIARAEAEFFATAGAQGHVLERTEEGKVNTFAMEAEPHNGPSCVKCHTTWCIHCEGAKNIQPCVG
jgi:hypothetical protein